MIWRLIWVCTVAYDPFTGSHVRMGQHLVMLPPSCTLIPITKHRIIFKGALYIISINSSPSKVISRYSIDVYSIKIGYKRLDEIIYSAP